MTPNSNAGRGVALNVPATRAHVLVCTGPQCSGRGARQLFRSAWTAYEEERIAYYRTGGSVRLTETGCLGACDFGPNIAVYEGVSDGLCRERWIGSVDLPALVAVGRELNAKRPAS